MFSLIYLVPIALWLWLHFRAQRYDRQTKLLVERERAKAMLSLKESQQKERDDNFDKQKALIAEAANRVRKQREVQGQIEVPPAVVDEMPPVAQPPKHSVDPQVFAAAAVPPAPVEVASDETALSVSCRADDESSQDSVCVADDHALT